MTGSVYRVMVTEGVGRMRVIGSVERVTVVMTGSVERKMEVAAMWYQPFSP